MTELATTTPAGAVALPQTAAVVQISEWAAELDAAHRLGLALSESGMVPDALKKEGSSYKDAKRIAADAAVVILAGKSVGLDPLAAVQNIFPVYGKPAMYARTMVGLAQGLGHEVERTSATNSSVTIRARRKGKTEWHSFTWDIERAKQAGYTGNKKYQTDPIGMLTAKAQAEACRVMFADVLMGMPYSVEDTELEDLGEVAAAEAKPAATVTRKPRGKKAEPAPKPEPKPEAPADAPAEDGTAQNPGAEPIGEQEWKDIKGLAGDLGIDDVGKFVSDELGRTLNGWREITVDEASKITTALEERGAGQ